MHLRVAVAHAAPQPGDSAANLSVIATLARSAAGAGARLLVLPQAFLTGPGEDNVTAAARALLSDDPAILALAAIARAQRIAILCGYLEVCTGRHHDSALFVDHRGCALANYRRTHFNPRDDPDVLARGQWLTMVPFADCRLGVLIGADIEAPEPAQALTLAGANVLLVLGRHGAELAIVGEAVLPARAFENRCALAYANAVVEAGAPRSRILGPRGELLAMAGDDLAIAELPLTPLVATGYRGAERRPQLYQKLTAIPPEQVALRG